MSEVLVVTSKIKKLIKTTGCNTSSEAVELLSTAVETLCKTAVKNAKNDGRKTVMARDIETTL